MKIFKDLKNLVALEQKYTRAILEKLITVERDKLYCDLKYPSLHKYLIRELGYSEAEATLRVNVVRIMIKSSAAKSRVLDGSMSLVNASEVNKAAVVLKDEVKINQLVETASRSSVRQFKKIVDQKFGRRRQEVLVLRDYMMEKFDRLRKKYGDLSSLELIEIMLEKELKAPGKMRRDRSRAGAGSGKSRSLAKSVKAQVYTGECANCGVRHGLEYDHKMKFSCGGSNQANNIQMLCRSCNGCKEVVARQSGFFF
jgi:5-methylcytosine-specific restriction endonuclease McrA